MKAYIYHNGIDGNEVSLDVYGAIGGQTFNLPVINLGRLKTKSTRNGDWKKRYEDAIKDVENGKAIEYSKIKEYIKNTTEEKAIAEAAAQDGQTFISEDRYLFAEPIHIIRDDGVVELEPNKQQSSKIKISALKLALRELLLPIMILILGVLSVIYTFTLEELDKIILIFSGILFASGIALFIKLLKTVLNLISGQYQAKVDTLVNVISFTVKVDYGKLETKYKSFTYYFADTNCFRCIPLTKSQYKKFKNKQEGNKVSIISNNDKLIIGSILN